MKKKFLQTLILIFFCCQAFAQQENGWIPNYSLKYYRIFVSQDGIYRLDSTTLANAGIDVSTLNPKQIQIFGRGKEQNIFITDKGGIGTFKSHDYIEFYGMHNDGWYDKKLYRDTLDQANPNYSMFNDTAIYYLTINPNVNPGKRMKSENDVNYSAYNSPPFFYKNSRADLTDKYYFGQTWADGVLTDPEYVASEGWFLSSGFGLCYQCPQTTTLIVPTAKWAAGNAYIDFKVIGTSDYAGLHPNHHIQISYCGKTITDLQDGYYSKHYFDTLGTSVLSSSSTNFAFSCINDLGSVDNPDGSTVAFINIKYAHQFNLETSSTFEMYIPNGTQSKSSLTFSGLTVNSGDTVFFYDLTNNMRSKASLSGTNYKVVDTNITAHPEKKCYITSEGQIHHVLSLEPVSRDPAHYAQFKNYADQSLANTKYLIVTNRALWNEARAYSDYRATTGFDTLVVDVNELYDQFSYGIRKDPLAIKNFARFAITNFNSPPENLFIIGKGYRAAEGDASQCYRKNPAIYSQTLVPGFGLPPSDILFTTFGTDYKQSIPTGRLAARSGTDVTSYLNKMVEYESVQSSAQSGFNPPQFAWMKNVLHFGGGDDGAQSLVLQTYLNHYKQIIEGPFFGGYVRTFLKNSTQPIQQNLSDSMKAIINSGVSIMTFFGHGAGIGFDVSIDYPSTYNNTAKYPLLIANSCLAGDLYSQIPSSSEEFVLIPEKGMIAYVASVANGLSDNLDKYSTQLYENIGVKKYGQSMGKCIKSTIDTLQMLYPGDFYAKSVCLEMTLHGDPALKINYFGNADYTLTPTDIFFTPANVTTQLDSFTLFFVHSNIGRALDTSYYVHIKRQFPDNSPALDTLLFVKAPMYKDTVKLKLPVNLAHGIGLNTFTVSLDCTDKVKNEISETNNSASTTLLITSDDISPVYPYKYAIVPSLNVTLKASTGNPFALPKNYVFQIDTTAKFNSPVLMTQTINHAGGVVTWTPVLPVTKDSIVYYWRVSIDFSYYHKFSWNESSFQYITGKRGWGQAHFFQFRNDAYTFIKIDTSLRKFIFVPNTVRLTAQTGYFTGNAHYNWTEEWLKRNEASLGYWSCADVGHSALKIGVFDSLSVQPWISQIPTIHPDTGVYGEFHCQSGYTTPCFDFRFSSNHDRDTVKYFLNHIPHGDYVVVMTHESPIYSSWNAGLLSAFQSIGSSITAASLPANNNTPYIIIGQKGAHPGSVPEAFSPSGDLVQSYEDITTNWTVGDIKSELIGPARSWDSLHWRVRRDIYDSVKLNVYGVKNDGTEVLVVSNLKPIAGNMDISLASVVDSTQYPYLRLDMQIMDTNLHTPSQMGRWQVIFKEVPETALDPSLNSYFYKDTLNEGDTLRFSTAIHNISEFNMDSLLVHYWVLDASRHIHPVYYHRFRKHPAGDILIDTVKYSTMGLPGLNSFWIEANPNNDQVEQYHFNNIGERYFYVRSDKTNPLLDVTFDGVHILDNDIVSAKPLIEIRLKDENKFLLMNNQSDTSLFNVFIQNPGASTANRIFFTQLSTGQQIMKFYPTTSANDNKCRIEYLADFPVDGTYKLIVQAKDKSNNKSGDNDYEINFDVINKSTITEVMNWPNPFSTSTRFVFTLTGSVIPTYFKIQIMTITGKVVREIGLNELGEIHIGRNITQYAWNGKDDFGDQLANGVYLYRVVSNINGKTIDKNATDADKYFTHEFGKMYLMH